MRAGALAVGVSIGAAAVAPASSVSAIDTIRVGAVTCYRLNDLLRAVGALKSISTALETGRVTIGSHEVALLAGSGIVRTEASAWSLPDPVVGRDGAFWVPLAFVTDVLAPLSAKNLSIERDLLFVDLEPGRLDFIDIRPGTEADSSGGEVVLQGRFPAEPVLRRDRERAGVYFEGCLPSRTMADGRLQSAGGGWRWRVRRESAGSFVEIIPPSGSGRFVWRERSADRVRLIVEPAGDLPAEGRGRRWRDRILRRIVIDPGHGGGDFGATLGGGVHEKWVTLDLARYVADSLRALGVEVVLTRNDDQELTADERAAFANEVEADLFVSLQIESYPARSIPDVRCLVHRPVDREEDPALAAGFRLIPWDEVQRIHLRRSEAFARDLLARAPSGVVVDPTPVSIPLPALGGVDMPAVVVLVAAGMTEPSRWRGWREAFARSCAAAVRDFSERVEG
jgi:N-acetylmuramoyl-L-alanine amidase